MSRQWDAKLIDLFLSAWKIAEGDSLNNLIIAALKNNDFARYVAHIDRQKYGNFKGNIKKKPAEVLTLNTHKATKYKVLAECQMETPVK